MTPGLSTALNGTKVLAREGPSKRTGHSLFFDTQLREDNNIWRIRRQGDFK